MKVFIKDYKKTIINVGLKSLIGSIFGWTLYYLLEINQQLGNLSYYNTNPYATARLLALPLYSFGLFLVGITGIFGGLFLGYILNLDLKKGILTLFSSLIKGAMIGGFCAILLSFVVLFLSEGIWLIDMFIIRLVVTSIIGLIIGGLIGGSSYRFLHNTRST